MSIINALNLLKKTSPEINPSQEERREGGKKGMGKGELVSK
jgi:hypothetical protein